MKDTAATLSLVMFLQYKTNEEMDQTLKWERNWRIKSNITKCKIAVFGCNRETVENYGGISVNNQPMAIDKQIKILGCNLNGKFNNKAQIASNYQKGMRNLIKIKRFYSAPVKIKKTLYKALVRPAIEYPYLVLQNTNKTNLKKLQNLQNKSLRFILGLKLKDKVRTCTIHEKLKIEPFNIRLNRLSKKMMYKAKEKYLNNPTKTEDLFYKLSDYTIESQPLKKKKRSIVERMDKYIFGKDRRRSVLNSLPPEENWIIPPALF